MTADPAGSASAAPGTLRSGLRLNERIAFPPELPITDRIVDIANAIDEVHAEPVGEAAAPLGGSHVGAPVEVEEPGDRADQAGEPRAARVDLVGGGVGALLEQEDVADHRGRA